jgi:hypothetical protein
VVETQGKMGLQLVTSYTLAYHPLMGSFSAVGQEKRFKSFFSTGCQEIQFKRCVHIFEYIMSTVIKKVLQTQSWFGYSGTSLWNNSQLECFTN